MAYISIALCYFILALCKHDCNACNRLRKAISSCRPLVEFLIGSLHIWAWLAHVSLS